MPDATPVVPDRNDAPTTDVYSRSRAEQISGKNPGFEYQYFSTQPNHPQYFGKKLQRHEIGDERIGYQLVEPWERVEAGTVTQGVKRADDTKGVDTTITHGDMILCRTPKANHAKYGATEERLQSYIDKQFRADVANLGAGVKVRTSIATLNDPHSGPDTISEDIRAQR